MKRFLLLLLLSCLLCMLYCTAVFSIDTPTFSPDGGSYSSSVTVTMACGTPGAVIKYTTNGVDPTPMTGTTYSSPITLTTTTNLKAIGWIMGQGYSSVKSATYTISAGVATPTFSPDGGTYYGTQSVTMSCSTSGAEIRYTTDGTDPTSSSTLYVSAVNITQDTNLKAKAFLGGTGSSIKSASYTILTQCATPTFSPDGGSYNNYQTVTMSCTTPSVTIRYTTDGNDPTDTSTAYSSPVAVNSSLTLKAKAFRTDLTASAVKSATYTLTVANLTFSPDAGTYNNNQSVTISCATTGATIRYTTDGTDPTTSSTTYSGTVSISQSWTLKAKAWKTGMTDSAIKSAAYVLLASTPTFSPDGGTFSTTQSVTMACATSGATIRYTTDGSDPTSGSTQYTGAVSVAQPLTLKAKAFKTGYTDSSTKSAGFSFYVATPTFSPDAGIYGGNQNITMACSASGAEIRYTTDGSEPTTASTLYSAPVSVTEDQTLKAKAFKTGWTASATKSAFYDLRFSGTCDTPVLHPTKIYPYVPLGVSITCTMTGVNIRYTVDGSEPTESSTLYDPEGYVVVGTPMTLKVKACKDDYLPSATASGVYVNEDVVTPLPYLWEQSVSTISPIPSVIISDIYEPNTIKLSITGGHTNFELKRSDGTTETTLSTNSTGIYADTFNFTSGATYTYSARGLGGAYASLGLPAPPQGADPTRIYTRYTWGTSEWKNVDVKPVRIKATENQAVDSRYDLRRADYHFLDFQFGNLAYRGGLFAGYANDPSRVGRSYVKFGLTPPTTDKNIWASSVNTYYTMSVANGSATVGSHFISDDSWSQNSIVWTTAPSFNPASPVYENTVTYDSANPQPRWCNWWFGNYRTLDQMYGDGNLSVAFAAKNEATNAWPYFAKRQYDESLSPNMLLAYKAPLRTLQIVLDTHTVKGGLTVRGRIYLNGPAPVGGLALNIGTTDPYHVFISPLTIPAGETSAPIVVSTAIVYQTCNVILVREDRTDIALATLTITP